MLVMEAKDKLFNELSKFIQDTLASEQLSDRAESQRERLLKRIRLLREASPPHTPYVDMTAGSPPLYKTEIRKTEIITDVTYEEFDIDRRRKIANDEMYSNPGNENIYYDESLDDRIDEKSYMIPDFAHRNNKSCLRSPGPALPPSNHSSGRNSLIKESDTCSFSSGSSRNEEAPEVQAPSPSALRCVAAKCGPLGRRGKYLMLDHVKQFWAAVLGRTLYLFNSEKDTKPTKQLDLAGYRARPVDLCRNDFRFEIVSPGNKTYQFATDKQSEMNQWIAALNSATKTEEGRESRNQTNRPEDEPIDDRYTRTPRANTNKRTAKTDGGSQRATDERRSLPLLPQETYDQPDPKLRPVCSSNQDYEHIHKCSTGSLQQNGHVITNSDQQITYDLPESTPRPVAQPSRSSTPVYSNQEDMYDVIPHDDKAVHAKKPNGRESRELPPIPLETYDTPDGKPRPVINSSVTDHLYQNFQLGEEVKKEISQEHQTNIMRPNDAARKLPPIPTQQEVYDLPDILVRPVNADRKNKNSCQQEEEEEIYWMAGDGTSVKTRPTDPNEKSDETYPEAETDQECIYDMPEQIALRSLNPECERKPIETPPPPKTITMGVKPSVAALASIIQANLKPMNPAMSNFKTNPWVKSTLKKTPQ